MSGSPNVFEFQGYKDFLRAWISSRPHKGHGSKAKLARAAQCQTAYISQVVLGNAHLSPEQGERIAQLLEFSAEETDYFLLLLQFERAGSESLRGVFRRQMARIRESRSQLKNRLAETAPLNEENKMKYFSSWIYAAVHTLTTIPGFRTSEAIAKRLNLKVESAEAALEFLAQCGLLDGSARMHLPHDSPLVSKHHMNWRLRAMQNIEKNEPESLHYSSIVSISRSDAARLREKILKEIETTKKVVKESKEEKLYSYSLDFFEV